MQSSISSRYELLAAQLQRWMGLYGYERLETPILQPADLFLTRAGDQIVARLFTFDHGGKQFALRPEYTSPAMSHYIREGMTAPVRWQFSGSVFAEAEDSTRQQHYSIGAEAIGWPSRLADAEIVALAVRGLQNVSLTDVRVHIGHIGLLLALVSRHLSDSRLVRFLLNHAYLLREPDGDARIRAQLDRLVSGRWDVSEATGESPSPAIMDALLDALERSQLMGGRTREDIQRRLQRKLARAEARPQLEAALALLRELTALEGNRAGVMPALRELAGDDEVAQALLAEWEQTLNGCERLGVATECIVVKPALSRNWDYYSGPVFELHGGGQHTGGGGRYDDLARLLGATKPVPAVGFAYYVDDMLAALPALPTKAASWALHANGITTALANWLDVLRGRGIAISVQPGAGTLRVSESGELIVGDRHFQLDDADTAAAWLEAQS
ncbi:MAG: ATP phosphoribosyltransferase regulatory subunit [Anaerolineae bacterium]|nr:ATP phosphoribosyltransferase regulatory subunit [Anaerolineae bacterium]